MSRSAAIARLAYFWGEDAYGLERAAKAYAAELEGAAGQPLEIWRTSGDDDDAGTAGDGLARRRSRMLDEVEQRLTTAPLFGAGTLVVVRQPGAVLREGTARERMVSLLGAVAPGNALCVLDLVAAGNRSPAAN
ncbi:MAG TPA: hypothetical protein VK992_00890, partial [Candidatus Caenarcaniphilales bacterium]|nr:hypothetical protein [Candidatus Caenarcaniphilales bacterium]